MGSLRRYRPPLVVFFVALAAAYAAAQQPVSIMPYEGPTTGGTTVTVNVGGSPSGMITLVTVDGAPLQGAVGGFGTMTGQTPPGSLGPRNVAVYVDGASTPATVVVNGFLYTYPPAPSGLVRHYAFDGNALDSTAAQQHGTVVGATPAADRFGTPGKAYNFSGAGNYIHASSNGLPTGARTVALWFYADTVAVKPILFGYGGSGSCGTSFIGAINTSTSGGAGNASYIVTAHCNIGSLLVPYGVPPVGVWKHFAATTGPAGTAIFIDGVQVGSNTTFISNTYVTGRQLAIGAASSVAGFVPYVDGNGGYFDGRLDDVRIYDRALSAEEIQTVMVLTSSETQLMFPGSDPDLRLQTSVGTSPFTSGGWADLKSVVVDDLVGVQLASPAGLFVGSPWFLCAQVFVTGMPTPGGAGPDLWLDVSDYIVVIDGSAIGPFGIPFLLPPGGTSLGFQTPAGLSGLSVVFQGGVWSPFAANGFVALSNAQIVRAP